MIKLDDRSSHSLAVLISLCLPCIWCTNIYSQIREHEIPLHSTCSEKEKESQRYTYHDRGDSNGLRFTIESNTSWLNSSSEVDCTYRNYKGSKNLKNKLYRKLTSIGKRNSFHSIEGDTDILKFSGGTFHVHKIFGDGNCMYRSISYIIWGDENEHRSLRTMVYSKKLEHVIGFIQQSFSQVVEHINDNWRDYSAFVMAEWNISNRQEYYDYMMANGTYATELECVVATKLYHMNLAIYREVDSKGNLERIFHNRVNKNYRTARLLFSGRTESGHYDVLIPD